VKLGVACGYHAAPVVCAAKQKKKNKNKKKNPVIEGVKGEIGAA
jgi:hypothetical protein